VYIWPIRVRL